MGIELRIAAVRGGALGEHEGLRPARRVARVAHRGEEQPAQLLLLPGRVEGGALHRAHPHPDADRVQVVEHGVGHRGEAGDGREVPGVDAVGEAGLG
jgi:hypothetical protein